MTKTQQTRIANVTKSLQRIAASDPYGFDKKGFKLVDRDFWVKKTKFGTLEVILGRGPGHIDGTNEFMVSIQPFFVTDLIDCGSMEESKCADYVMADVKASIQKVLDRTF